MKEVLFSFLLTMLAVHTNQLIRYSWTNKTSHKVTVNFKYSGPVDSGTILSKEMNPGESFNFDVFKGACTQAVLTGGRWNGSFGILYMSCNIGGNAPGHYDIK